MPADLERKVNLDYTKLPTTKEQILELASSDTAMVLLKIQRLRDFFNPVLDENKVHADDYNRFILAMLQAWLQTKNA
jgi:hypothetical protein